MRQVILILFSVAIITACESNNEQRFLGQYDVHFDFAEVEENQQWITSLVNIVSDVTADFKNDNKLTLSMVALGQADTHDYEIRYVGDSIYVSGAELEEEKGALIQGNKIILDGVNLILVKK